MIFGLIHGGCHSPWSWTYLEPELAARGHESIAVDLPIEDPSADHSGSKQKSTEVDTRIGQDPSPVIASTATSR